MNSMQKTLFNEADCYNYNFVNKSYFIINSNRYTDYKYLSLHPRLLSMSYYKSKTGVWYICGDSVEYVKRMGRSGE